MKKDEWWLCAAGNWGGWWLLEEEEDCISDAPLDIANASEIHLNVVVVVQFVYRILDRTGQVAG